MITEKQAVHDFWNAASCGEKLYLRDKSRAAYEAEEKVRYQLEPYILEFAEFANCGGRKVLEIGVGLGADHKKFAEAGAELYGIDLTERAVLHARNRLALFGLKSVLEPGDAENLSFPDETFDLVYSWGVLHHSPDTPKAISEVCRVLKTGGVAKIMIYHKWSLVGIMLWARYALLALRPWTGLNAIYSKYLESPGTKAYSVAEARELFSAFKHIEVRTILTHGDLLESDAGQRHQGILLSMARLLWPRRLFRYFLPDAGLFMLITARK